MSTNTASQRIVSYCAPTTRSIDIRPRRSITSNVSIPNFTLPTVTPKSSDRDTPLKVINSLTAKIEKYNKSHSDCITPFASSSVCNSLDQKTFLSQAGYVDLLPLCNTLQGQLYRAKSTKLDCDVIIKKTFKKLYQQRITVQNGTNIIVEENIVKESLILHHLTVDNKAYYDYIARFIQFLETQNAYYLVMENAGNMNLADFIKKAHQLIDAKQMKIKYWRKIVKYVFWQIAILMHWLHNDMKCCHLDLNAENIMILNGNFFQDKEDDTMSVDPNIKIKLVDFGLAEIFGLNTNDTADDEYRNNPFKCRKHGITDKYSLSAPRVFGDEIYDARKSDMWALGVILYELSSGLEPYKAPNVTDPAFSKIKAGKFLDLIGFHNKVKHFNVKMMNLISDLLNTREIQRIDSYQLLQNEWLCLYYQKYKAQIDKKSKLQLSRNKILKKKMALFPYYK